ncbi:MAG: sulfotransferase [Candidatus Thiodiazotropha sp.]
MYPHFICIGAQRAGTTWLHSMLRERTDIWLPRIKEIHYFDRVFPLKKDDWQYKARNRVSQVKQRLQRMTFEKLINFLKNSKYNDIKWELNYYLREINDSWYESLFEPAGSRIAGDITPCYALLSDVGVQHVASLVPNAKILFLIRNPIYRAYSHAVKDFTRFSNKRPQDIPLAEYRQHFNQPNSILRGQYLNTIDLWTRYYSEQQVMVRFYDEIKNSPESLLSSVLHHIGANNDISFDADYKRSVNASKEYAIDPALKIELANIYRNEIYGLAERFGNYASEWASECEDLLSNRIK